METKKNKKKELRQIIRILFVLCVVAPLVGCSKDEGPSGSSVNKVTIKSMSPHSPATLKFGDDVTITYDYEVSDPVGVRIWVQPYTNGQKTPKFRYTSSPLMQGKGSRTVNISVTSGTSIVVDQVLVKIASADVTQTLSETFQTVNYTFTN